MCKTHFCFTLLPPCQPTVTLLKTKNKKMSKRFVQAFPLPFVRVSTPGSRCGCMQSLQAPLQGAINSAVQASAPVGLRSTHRQNHSLYIREDILYKTQSTTCVQRVIRHPPPLVSSPSRGSLLQKNVTLCSSTHTSRVHDNTVFYRRETTSPGGSRPFLTLSRRQAMLFAFTFFLQSAFDRNPVTTIYIYTNYRLSPSSTIAHASTNPELLLLSN